MDDKLLQEARKRVGNTFALTVLLQKRCQELVRGARRLTETNLTSHMDIALDEIASGKIWLTEFSPKDDETAAPLT